MDVAIIKQETMKSRLGGNFLSPAMIAFLRTSIVALRNEVVIWIDENAQSILFLISPAYQPSLVAADHSGWVGLARKSPRVFAVNRILATIRKPEPHP
jgi:hypothetical protein